MATPAKRTAVTRARTNIRTSATKLEKKVQDFCKSPVAGPGSWSMEIDVQLRTWLDTVKRLENELKEANARVEATYDDEKDDAAIEAEYQSCEEYADRLASVRAWVEAYRMRYDPANEVQARPTNGTNPSVVGGESAGASASGSGVGDCLNRLVTLQEDSATGAVQLPTTKLSRFAGGNQDFLTFIDEFRRFVHERTGISDLQRHKILRDALEGEAARTVRGVLATEAGYWKTLNLLLMRYGCVDTIVYGALAKLSELPKVGKVGDVVALRGLLDFINGLVVTLDMLKFDEKHYGAPMYPLLLRAIPDDLAVKFVAKNRKKSEIDVSREPSLVLTADANLAESFIDRFQQLRDFLAEELASLEHTRSLCPRSERDQKSRPPAGSRANQRSANVYMASDGAANGRAAGRGSGRHNRDATAGGRTGGATNNNSTQQQQLGDSGTEHGAAKGDRDKVATGRLECLFCSAEHHSSQCQASISVERRRLIVKERGVCVRCLESGHWVRRCTKRVKCGGCQGGHYEIVCPKSGGIAVTSLGCSRGLLPTGHVEICDDVGSKAVTRFLLDSGSQRSFVTARLVDSLKLPVLAHESLYLHVFGGASPAKPHRLPVVRVRLLPRKGSPIDVVALVIETITASNLPAPSRALRAQLEGTDLAEVEGGPSEIGLLLNATDSCRVTDGARRRVDDQTFLIETRFGGVVVSQQDYERQGTVLTSMTIPNLERFFDLETLGIRPDELEVAADLTDVAERFRESIERLPDGRYQVKMNLRPNVATLASNAEIATRQLRTLAKRLAKNDALRRDYAAEIRFFLDQGFAERVPEGESLRYVMPHFPVVQPAKESYKVRPVFNASSAAGGQLSLNDCIEDTPNLLPCPLRALTNFRCHSVVWTGDISKAYLMVRVHPDQRNYLGFYWFTDDEALSGQTAYRMTSTAFGVKDSQHNTITVIREHAKAYAARHPEASKKLITDLYMDDILTGADTVAATVRLWREMTAVLQDAGMVVKKFKSNSRVLRDLFGTQSAGSKVLARPADIAKVLGVSWDQERDVLLFCPKAMKSFVAEAPPTMRTLMGACARLYDPQGLLSPFVMALKQILQDAHLAKLAIDATLPPELLKRWLAWGADLNNLAGFQVSRCLRLREPNIQIELHAFSDASDRAYAAAVYVKAANADGGVSVSLVASKAKLAPLKQLDSLTIPKKELMAATLAVRLLRRVKDYLEIPEAPVHCWSDAQVVLHWIHSSNPARWGVFVKNRLAEILQETKPSQWAHCPGKENPADMPSRGTSMAKLNESRLWLEGPAFLKNPSAQYPVFREDPSMALPEASVMLTPTAAPLLDPAEFSCLRRLVRVAAWVRRAAKRFQEKASGAESVTLGPLSGAELTVARQELLAEAQTRCLGDAAEALKEGRRPEDPAIAAFNPFVDEFGLVRVGGRLQFSSEPFSTRHPILLRDDPLTRLLILESHSKRMGHMKTDAVMSNLRQRFWIVRARALVKTVIHRCGGCRRDSARLADAQEAPLPAARIEMSCRPFKTTGIDYFGPLEVNTGTATKKVWVAIFTCAVIRAVHLEVVEDLTAGSCLAAIRRFAALHGVPSRIISDNALTFTKANRSLVALWKALSSEQVADYFGHEGVSWEFNAPRAPWWGGFYERLIRVTKECLRKAIGAQRLALLSLVTVLHEIAAVINQRPLTRVPDGVKEPQALTPSMFLAPGVPLTLPPGQLDGLPDRSEKLIKAWRVRERVLNMFWKRWRSEYLLMLRSAMRVKKGNDVVLAPGDIVLLEQAGTPRNFWQLGRIEEVLPSRDGVARSYRVHLGKGRFVNRAGRLLAKLM